MTNAHGQIERQTHKVITYHDFIKCQESAENSIKYHFGHMLIQVNALCKMGAVLSASSLHRGKKELLIFVHNFLGQQTSETIV